MKLFLPENSFS